MSTRAPTALALCTLSSVALAAAPEELRLYPDPSGRVRPSVWNMKHEERDGRMYLNGDRVAAPWAGIVFVPAERTCEVSCRAPGCERTKQEFQTPAATDQPFDIGAIKLAPISANDDQVRAM